MTNEQITQTNTIICGDCRDQLARIPDGSVTICKECGNELTKEDIEKVGHNRRGYCISCNKEHKKRNRLANRAKGLNVVHTGDNLKVMKYIPNNYIDLIYLDPPYYTQTNWKNGKNEFSDNWKDKDEYIEFMKVRLVEMHRILKPTGSIYLHVDHHAVFELKPIMDKIFGRDNFQNDIIWHYGLGGSSNKRFSRKHDTILFYSKSDNMIFKPPMVPATSQKMKGQLKKADDVWDIPSINNMAKERTGYPTQKPEILLKRIIESSSTIKDIIFDPFCGSGTTLEVAKKLNRNYIGVDENKQAVKISKERIMKTSSLSEWV